MLGRVFGPLGHSAAYRPAPGPLRWPGRVFGPLGHSAAYRPATRPLRWPGR